MGGGVFKGKQQSKGIHSLVYSLGTNFEYLLHGQECTLASILLCEYKPSSLSSTCHMEENPGLERQSHLPLVPQLPFLKKRMRALNSAPFLHCIHQTFIEHSVC
jgi:hypothetical protein